MTRLIKMLIGMPMDGPLQQTQWDLTHLALPLILRMCMAPTRGSGVLWERGLICINNIHEQPNHYCACSHHVAIVQYHFIEAGLYAPKGNAMCRSIHQ